MLSSSHSIAYQAASPQVKRRSPPLSHAPQGAGEPSIFPIAAAINAAIFDATAKRLRAMPMSPERVLAALRA